MVKIKYSKNRLLILLPWAIVAGFILTLLLTGQENFKQLPSSPCANPVYFNVAQIKSVACATLDEGYPMRFLRTSPGVDTTGSSNEVLDVASVPKVATYRLIGDVAFWSVFSLIVLLYFVPTSSKKLKR